MTARVCVVGSSNLDLTFRVAELPRPGETRPGSDFLMGCGGKGANQAVAAARLGAQVAMVSKVGADVFGERLLQNFALYGVDVQHVTRSEGPSGVAAILVDDAARNCIVVVPGANAALTPDDIRRAAIAHADILLCQLEVPVGTTREALRLARNAGVRTLLNPAPAAPLPDDLLALVDLCVPNEHELALLTGLPTSTRDDVVIAARLLRERGPRAVIVTRGEQGALMLDGETVAEVAAFPVAAVDTSGAGDAFIGALAVFLAEGLPLLDAARRASAAAALSVTRVGTQSALPTRAEVETLIGLQ
jgi:ribokinase